MSHLNPRSTWLRLARLYQGPSLLLDLWLSAICWQRNVGARSATPECAPGASARVQVPSSAVDKLFPVDVLLHILTHDPLVLVGSPLLQASGVPLEAAALRPNHAAGVPLK